MCYSLQIHFGILCLVKTEVQREKVTCPISYSKLEAELEIEPRVCLAPGSSINQLLWNSEGGGVGAALGGVLASTG